MVHTHIHTNVLKGGKTDASLEYFNMKDYFGMEIVTEYVVISQSDIKECLKKDTINSLYFKKIREMENKGLKKKILKDVFEQINQDLFNIGLKLTHFEQFVELFEIKKENKMFNLVAR